MKSNELRQAFLDFFVEHGHQQVASSSLVPGNDPTLLFTNAGMVQFKDVFLGEARPYDCATSSQRCVRAGGKHNDLENVGYTARHHTFFEMLGNFSFGAYFKREAISLAWKLLTEVFKLPPEKLWVTVYHEDSETEAIWKEEIGIDPERFSRCGKKDNFWSMGETGPCGPCTEIFYDHGADIWGGPPGSPEEDGDRYIEIWNLVFMQYNRDASGTLTPLPKPCVDTGMGLERIAAVLQGVHNNYEIDLFQHLLKSLSQILDFKDITDKSMCVIVDHIRSTSFLITDRVTPSNEGRGYVLRRIIRRAVRHGFKLGATGPFFYKLVAALVEIMGEAYPELAQSQSLIEQVLKQEEIQFANTLEKGLKILDEEVAGLSGNEIPGRVVFQLYDTYGFPPDLTADIARERELTLDMQGFDEHMSRQREQSQAASRFSVDQTQQLHINGETTFTGYDTVSDTGTVITLLSEDLKPLSTLEAGSKGVVVLDRTPFYAESGGQVGDSGYLIGTNANFRVQDTQKHGKVYLHYGELVKGTMQVADEIEAEVDEARQATILNHSATHLLHEALRRVLGEHVIQKGSLVEPKRLRFDFSHPKAMTAEEIQATERLVNQQIRENTLSEVSEGSLEDAKAKGAMALFGEKYGDRVRVVKMGDFSTEVCGGTHAKRSGDIGIFKITQETACASGVRRIEAVTGAEAIRWIEESDAALLAVTERLKTNRENVIKKFDQLIDQQKQMTREITRLKQQLANQQSGSIRDQVVDVEGIHVLAANMGAVDRDTLRKTLDQLRQELGSAAIILASVEEEKIQLVSGLSKDCLSHFNATQLLNQVAGQVGGKGGGRPDMAQGGGDNPAALPDALASVADWVKGQLAS